LQQVLKSGNYVLVKFKHVGEKELLYIICGHSCWSSFWNWNFQLKVEAFNEEHTKFLLVESDISVEGLNDFAYKLAIARVTF